MSELEFDLALDMGLSPASPGSLLSPSTEAALEFSAVELGAGPIDFDPDFDFGGLDSMSLNPANPINYTDAVQGITDITSPSSDNPLVTQALKSVELFSKGITSNRLGETDFALSYLSGIGESVIADVKALELADSNNPALPGLRAHADKISKYLGVGTVKAAQEQKERRDNTHLYLGLGALMFSYWQSQQMMSFQEQQRDKSIQDQREFMDIAHQQTLAQITHTGDTEVKTHKRIAGGHLSTGRRTARVS